MFKKFLSLCLLVTIFSTMVGCTKVPAGHVEVKVYLLGSNKGVYTANAIKAKSLSNEIIEYEKVINQRIAIEKWNRALPQVMASGSVPFINVK